MKIKDYLMKLKDSNSIAIEDENNQFTYSELYVNIEKNSEIIRNINDARQNIAMCLPNSICYIAWYYSIIQSDNVVVPIYFNSSSTEINNIINSCDVSILISNDEKIKTLDFSSVSNRVYIINIDTNQLIELNNNRAFVTPEIPDNDVALMISTSGSFNNPKRVMLTNKNIITNALAIIDSLNYSSNDVFLALLPLCFASANTSQLIVSLILGTKIVIYNDLLLPKYIRNYINNKSVTTMTVVPSIFKTLVESGSFDTSLVPTLRTICFGGGPTYLDIIKKAALKFSNINLVHMYGQTEASARLTHLTGNYFIEKLGSVGKPLKNIDIIIVNEDLQRVKIGEEGEVAVRGDNVMLGYYKQPSETQKVLVDGYLLTGDIGRLDKDGFLYITGRKKNLIIYSGINIYPEEIESVIFKNENIDDVVVYGIQDENFGEVIVADVVLKQSCNLDIAEFQQICMQELPMHKIPSKINIVDKLKRTNNGKLQRKA